MEEEEGRLRLGQQVEEVGGEGRDSEHGQQEETLPLGSLGVQESDEIQLVQSTPVVHHHLCMYIIVLFIYYIYILHIFYF